MSVPSNRTEQRPRSRVSVDHEGSGGWCDLSTDGSHDRPGVARNFVDDPDYKDLNVGRKEEGPLQPELDPNSDVPNSLPSPIYSNLFIPQRKSPPRFNNGNFSLIFVARPQFSVTKN